MDMIHNLPKQYRKDKWVLSLVFAVEGELEEQEADARSIVDQMSLDKVSWNLPVEERIAAIFPKPTQTTQERREMLKAKWRMIWGKISEESIQAVCDAWQNGATEVTFDRGMIHIRFVGEKGIPSDLDTLLGMLRTAIPAHLGIDYTFAFFLIEDIHLVMDLDTLQSHAISEFAFNFEEAST